MAVDPVLFYNGATGELAVTKVDFGTVIPKQFTHTERGWTHIVPVDQAVVFYRSGDGVIQIGQFDTAGDLRLHAPTNGSSGWTHVVATNHRVMFYNSATGAVWVGFVDDAGTLQPSKAGSTFPGRTHVVSFGNHVAFGQFGQPLLFIVFVSPDGTLNVVPKSASAPWERMVGVGPYLLLYQVGAQGSEIRFGAMNFDGLDISGPFNDGLGIHFQTIIALDASGLDPSNPPDRVGVLFYDQSGVLITGSFSNVLGGWFVNAPILNAANDWRNIVNTGPWVLYQSGQGATQQQHVATLNNGWQLNPNWSVLDPRQWSHVIAIPQIGIVGQP